MSDIQLKILFSLAKKVTAEPSYLDIYEVFLTFGSSL